MVQNRYYYGLVAYIGAFHPPEHGPVYAPTRHTGSTNVENFGSKLRPKSAVAEISGHLCAYWVHILGCGPRQNWVPILVASQKKFHCHTPKTKKISMVEEAIRYHGELSEMQLQSFGRKPAERITFRLMGLRSPNFQDVFSH